MHYRRYVSMSMYTEKDFDNLKFELAIIEGNSRTWYPNKGKYWVCGGSNYNHNTTVFGPFRFKAAVRCYKHNKHLFPDGLYLVDCSTDDGFNREDVCLWGTYPQIFADLKPHPCKKCNQPFIPRITSSWEYCFYCYPKRYEFTCNCGKVFDYGSYRLLCDKCKRESIRESNRAAARNRRARKLRVGGIYSQNDVKLQYKRQRGKCYYCQKKVGKKYHIDHVIPLTRENSWNGPENLVIACPVCNLKKSDKMPHEWAEGGRLM